MEFDISIQIIEADSLHLIDLGITKRMLMAWMFVHYMVQNIYQVTYIISYIFSKKQKTLAPLTQSPHMILKMSFNI
uniref:Uncharacterized protein n=1 Tax=Anopheles quadriannulatus TaxID=34691 RepID=A0A182X637_ANOQN